VLWDPFGQWSVCPGKNVQRYFTVAVVQVLVRLCLQSSVECTHLRLVEQAESACLRGLCAQEYPLVLLRPTEKAAGGLIVSNDYPTNTTVPEPDTLGLLTIGILGLVVVHKLV